jgi:hypothetical protein
MVLNFRVCCFLALVFSFGCERDGVFTPDNFPPKLFVRGRLDPNLGVQVLVTKAVSTSDTVTLADLLISNAVVLLRDESGNVVSIPANGKSVYFLDNSSIAITAGKKYQLEVQETTLGTVVSEWETVPEPVIPTSVNFAPDGGQNGDSPTGSGSIVFNDPPNVANYYFCNAFGRADGYPSLYANLFFEIGFCEKYFRDSNVVFSDGCLGNGSSSVAQLSCDLDSYVSDIQTSVPFSEISITFGVVSKSYFDFLFSLEQPEEWDNGLIEPKAVFSNINNGLGVFYTSNTAMYVIPL